MTGTYPPPPLGLVSFWPAIVINAVVFAFLPLEAAFPFAIATGFLLFMQRAAGSSGVNRAIDRLRGSLFGCLPVVLLVVS